MSKASRDKGKRGEREACEALADVWPGLQRTYHQSRSGDEAPDIDCPACPVWIEVKRQERINIHAAMAQALLASKADFAPRPPLVLHKRNRGDWLVTLRARDLAGLIRDAREEGT